MPEFTLICRDYCAACEYKKLNINCTEYSSVEGYCVTDYSVHCEHEDVCAMWLEKLEGSDPY